MATEFALVDLVIGSRRAALGGNYDTGEANALLAERQRWPGSARGVIGAGVIGAGCDRRGV